MLAVAFFPASTLAPSNAQASCYPTAVSLELMFPFAPPSSITLTFQDFSRTLLGAPGIATRSKDASQKDYPSDRLTDCPELLAVGKVLEMMAVVPHLLAYFPDPFGF